MASTYKTTYLQLNQWATGDRPARVDYNNDNTKIDNAVGPHINNTNIHCTAGEREVAARPVEVVSVVGNGTTDLTVGTAPTCNVIFVFSPDKPLQETGEDGKIHCYASLWTKTPEGFVYQGGGVSIVNGQTHLYGKTVGSKVYHLNENGVRYVVLYFRTAQ